MNDSIDKIKKRKFRIAPTPSGFLHAGNGASFVLTALLARCLEAPLLLRIDDIDNERKRKEYLNDIFYSLDWLGIEWQEGPEGPDDFEANWSQHKRIDLYSELLDILAAHPEVYACQCSRSSLTDGIPCPCRLEKDFGTAGIAWKIRIPSSTSISFKDCLSGNISINMHTIADPVLRKKDLLPAYQVCSLADDIHFGVTDIVRGRDLLESTAIQIFLAGRTGNSRFPLRRFYHHPLLTNKHGRKISKSADDESIQSIRRRQGTPNGIYQVTADWLQIKTQASTFEELYKAVVEVLKQRFN